jgi:hypothetical protein
MLEFDNGQKALVPLYVPLAAGDTALERRAVELATEIGQRAARAGELDTVELILNGTIPFREFLQHRLRAARDASTFPDGVTFSSSVDSASSKATYLLRVPLYNGHEKSVRASFLLGIPRELAAPALAPFLNQAVDEVLGAGNRRSRLKSSASPHVRLPPDTPITSMPGSYLNCRARGNASASFSLDPSGQTFNCSLGVKSPLIAAERLDRVKSFIRQSLQAGTPLTVSDVREFCQQLTHESGAGEPPARVNRSRAGPVVIYRPRMGTDAGQPKEALRLYTALSGQAESGLEMRASVVGPGGRGTNYMYVATCIIPVKHGIVLAQAELLRRDLREFMEQRLSAFYSAGGEFRDQADIGFGVSGRPALTPLGAEKFQRILEGRLTSGFVQKALEAGIANPFDVKLPPETVRKLGGFRSMPQPAHSALRLLNPHEIPGLDGKKGIRSSLVWDGPDGREILRRELKFAGIADLASFTREIDQWTAQQIAGGQSLPRHTGVEFIRQLCQPRRDPRQNDLD